MTEFQVTSWRDIPSMVASRDEMKSSRSRCTNVVRRRSTRRLCAWEMSMPTPTSPDGCAASGQRAKPSEVAADVARDLEASWDEARLAAYLDSLSS